MTASNTIFNSDLNARYFLSVSARLEHFAERINQQDQVIAENRKKDTVPVKGKYCNI